MVRFLVIIFYFYSYISNAGPLDIESIKIKCSKKYKVETSEEYTRCIEIEVNKNLYEESKTKD